MAKESLIEIGAEHAAKEGSEFNGAEPLVERVRTAGKCVEYTTVTDSEWRTLTTVHELARVPVSDVVRRKSIHFSEEQLSSLRELRSKAKEAWDEETEMFTVEKRLDRDGDVIGLYVPLRTDISDDVSVVELYNDAGEFVAQDLENELGSEIQRLSTDSLQAEGVFDEKTQIYVKGSKYSALDLFTQSVDEGIDEDEEIGDARQWVGTGAAFGVGTLLLLPLYFLWSFSSSRLYLSALGFFGIAFSVWILVSLPDLVYTVREYGKVECNELVTV